MRLHYAVITVAYCAAIFWLSSQPEPPVPRPPFPFADKIAHAVLYGGLAAVVSMGLHRSQRWSNPYLLRYGPVAFAMLYGLTDEYHQLFVASRNFEMLDLAADALGATVAQLTLYRYAWSRSLRAHDEG